MLDIKYVRYPSRYVLTDKTGYARVIRWDEVWRLYTEEIKSLQEESKVLAEKSKSLLEECQEALATCKESSNKLRGKIL